MCGNETQAVHLFTHASAAAFEKASINTSHFGLSDGLQGQCVLPSEMHGGEMSFNRPYLDGGRGSLFSPGSNSIE